MSFQPKTWRNNPPSSNTPITAAELNRIEDGIRQAMVNRGWLRQNADLNTFSSTEVNGSYSVDPTRTYYNIPVELSAINQGGVFTVNIPSNSANTGGLQELIWGGNRWWREARNLSENTWYEWHRVNDYGPRGWLPRSSDLNTYSKVEDSGIYFVNAGWPFENLPPGVSAPNQGGIFKVDIPSASGATGGFQELIWGGNRWWREVRNIDRSDWYEWYRVPLWGDFAGIEASDIVQSSTVKRIVTSANPDVPLDDGDLLVVWEG